jgi:hypothetical protein
MLRKKQSSDSIIDYRMNMQHIFSHSNYANVEGYGVLLQIFKKDNDKVFEIEESKLGEVINRLKEIYNKIKIN